MVHSVTKSQTTEATQHACTELTKVKLPLMDNYARTRAK